ncbi:MULTISPECIES: prephenate dehydratase [unclassified Saccharopolyspora]|uniref:prephenate dehydratase n=1 Tax=Saccharopolyspora TaxID=1835 RepID=UPI00190DCA44|nr:prephenate dehydratase [Saccharopolyspora sp. HNM0986]MBK0865423.1 prephenate dehydratase [Saccharopolyspora sp. HNM0986]
MPQIAYLGPPGTFTEQATRVLTADFDAEPVPFETVPQALSALRSGDVLAAGVPVENSVEGAVPATMDALVSGEPLIAVGEAMIPVRFDVLVRAGATADQVGTVASHPHAIAQVREWLADRLPQAEVRAAGSTAAAARSVAAGEVDAAISSPLAIEQFSGLERLATGVADVPDALTRFLLLRRPGALPEPTGADRTSIAAVIGDEVGSLTELLMELSLRGINLSRIESRPTKDRLGEYRFFLDFDGHVADARVGDALTGLRRRCSEVRFLGSYPKADHSPASVRPSASEQAFQASARWLERIRAGGSP